MAFVPHGGYESNEYALSSVAPARLLVLVVYGTSDEGSPLEGGLTRFADRTGATFVTVGTDVTSTQGWGKASVSARPKRTSVAIVRPDGDLAAYFPLARADAELRACALSRGLLMDFLHAE